MNTFAESLISLGISVCGFAITVRSGAFECILDVPVTFTVFSLS